MPSTRASNFYLRSNLLSSLALFATTWGSTGNNGSLPIHMTLPQQWHCVLLLTHCLVDRGIDSITLTVSPVSSSLLSVNLREVLLSIIVDRPSHTQTLSTLRHSTQSPSQDAHLTGRHDVPGSSGALRLRPQEFDWGQRMPYPHRGYPELRCPHYPVGYPAG